MPTIESGKFIIDIKHEQQSTPFRAFSNYMSTQA